MPVPAAHGLRRTNEDKRRAVLTLLRDEEWSKKSQRWIAERCGVSHQFVANMQGELSTVDSSATLAERTTGKDGKSRPATRQTFPNVVPSDTSTEPVAERATPHSPANRFRSLHARKSDNAWSSTVNAPSSGHLPPANTNA
jgi:hypothetical protein